ncbi:WXG100 family type VII secretion target [Motilibacter deserti]|uniref:Uncharacterized protein n=1 Tax=Motilibacter deserti TaxID=2714956 RepID=A0ABX0GZP2_9ACTN|nr:WXG100 family type VII secretion target [Motilibacter deserti]NHC16453.1 hypothetical protein [Motilibacter deserti]
MSLGEPLEDLARRVSRFADDVRREHARLRTAVPAVRWASSAASRFRERAEEHAQALARAADRLDEAATSLLQHARQVREREEDLAEAVLGGVRAAAGALHDAAGAVAGRLR